jgi:hypothetical protein
VISSLLSCFLQNNYQQKREKTLLGQNGRILPSSVTISFTPADNHRTTYIDSECEIEEQPNDDNWSKKD